MATSTFSIVRRISPRDSSSVLPFSAVTTALKSSMCSSIKALSRKSTCVRSTAGTIRQLSNADSAAEITSLISVAVESGALAMTSPFAGLVTSIQSPVDDSTHSPPMKFLRVSISIPPLSFPA